LEGKKYLWDGYIYENEADAQRAEKGYKSDGFETKILHEGERYLVYTRRVVEEVVVEGPPPP
jgi:hypothetical protein